MRHLIKRITATEIAHTLLDFLLPSVCPGCHVATGPLLCSVCIEGLPRLPHPCPWCGSPRKEQHQACRACAGRGFVHVTRLSVGFAYAGVIEHLVGDAKAGSKPAAARALAALMPAVPVAIHADTLVMPIPPARGRRPGPHLATRLARVLAKRDGLSFARALSTTRLAAEQHRLTAAQRRDNVADLFVCRGAMSDDVVLVDDLVTSGATASAAALALKRAGAKRVIVVCLARTPRRNEKE